MAEKIMSNGNHVVTQVHERSKDSSVEKCPICGHKIQSLQRGNINEMMPGLPAGVKFDPTDEELLEHLQGKIRPQSNKHHYLIDQFIPTIEGDNGICYAHPEKLPGVSTDGQIKHYFHRPCMAYTTGTRKRRRVHSYSNGSETRWHKTGKTRPLTVGGEIMGFKKILVLYTSYGKKKKPEKTYWVMHQYHLGSSEDEREGELVVSKVFYQTQPRQSGSGQKAQFHQDRRVSFEPAVEIQGSTVDNSVRTKFISCGQRGSCVQSSLGQPQTLGQHLLVATDGPSFDLALK